MDTNAKIGDRMKSGVNAALIGAKRIHKKASKKITRKHIIFLILFAALVFAGSRINFSQIVGSTNQSFTLFQFFGPIAGSFLGPIFGAVSVLVSQISDYLIFGKAFTMVNVLRLLPMLFAAYYFGVRKKSWSRALCVIVPILAMILFISHPTGRVAWLYAMYWWIPVIVALLPEKYSSNIILKSFGATFTAHAIGSVVWLYAFQMTPEQWIGLIPVVAFERSMFALGIIGSYIGMNLLLCKVVDWFKVPEAVLHIDKSYLVARLWHKA